MQKDKRVILFTSDTGALVLDAIRRDFPKRCINVGIAEANMVSVAAGLAMSGKVVYIYAIVPFVTMRCYEQIRIDICCQNLPVKIIGIGAGMDYSTLGPTHHGHEDIALMRMLPGMTILSPSDKTSAATFAAIAHKTKGPVYVRLERYGRRIYRNVEEKFSKGLNILRGGEGVVIIATGRMVITALDVAEQLSKKRIEASVIDLYRLKPVSAAPLLKEINKAGYIFTIEEHSFLGGLGSSIAEILAECRKNIKFKRFGFPDKFCRRYGERECLHRLLNIDSKAIAKGILSFMHKL